ncbi:hypothetical protein L195_g002814 [Trifolium pratense]|uniref:Uncharacterized protein n=1 Tax=Trifolium pratense TaxID=57577 RepID=A0A2K3NTI1_TRIPR|nr:hypothetical protein L195_g002814 [Trifolium pratense]
MHGSTIIEYFSWVFDDFALPRTKTAIWMLKNKWWWWWCEGIGGLRKCWVSWKDGWPQPGEVENGNGKSRRRMRKERVMVKGKRDMVMAMGEEE